MSERPSLLQDSKYSVTSLEACNNALLQLRSFTYCTFVSLLVKMFFFTWLKEEIAFAFWWNICFIVKSTRYVALLFIPTSVVESLIVNKLAKWRIKVTFDGEQAEKFDKKKYDVEMRIHNKRFFKRFAYDQDLALGDSYMVNFCFFPPSSCACLSFVSAAVSQIAFFWSSGRRLGLQRCQ